MWINLYACWCHYHGVSYHGVINTRHEQHDRYYPLENCMYTYTIVGESNRIRTGPEYGHSRYLRNHKSDKTNVNE